MPVPSADRSLSVVTLGFARPSSNARITSAWPWAIATCSATDPSGQGASGSTLAAISTLQ